MKAKYIYEVIHNSRVYYFDTEEQMLANVKKLGKIIHQTKTRFTILDGQIFIFDVPFKKIKINEDI